jgi:hypothetical protein
MIVNKKFSGSGPVRLISGVFHFYPGLLLFMPGEEVKDIGEALEAFQYLRVFVI